MKKKIILLGFLIGFIPQLVFASETFNINPNFDIDDRNEIEAFSHEMSDKAYFYVEEDYYEALTMSEKQQLEKALSDLGREFDNVIYPTLTSKFGSEWSPGIDNDKRIFVLFHQMKQGFGGYFNTSNEYSRFEATDSNEKEMVYLGIDFITHPIIKSYLAHEFTHLITFNQKDRLRDAEEEVWLNEARAEYAATLLGYDKDFEASNLKQRVETFKIHNSDSLTEWKNQEQDYGVLNIFTQYLVEQYGIEILTDSLHTSRTGISSLNYALEKNEFDKNFSDVFADWMITVFLNDCKIGPQYCYQEPSLKKLRISPLISFLPVTGESVLKYGNSTQAWSGNWLKIVGGSGRALELEFDGSNETKFRLPYLVQKLDGSLKIDFLDLNLEQDAKLSVPDFGKETTGLILFPFILEKTSNFSSSEPYYSFFWSASIKNNTNDEELKQQLRLQIAQLKAQIIEVKAKIEEILAARNENYACQALNQNLSIGMSNNSVKCLQQFLKSQSAEIYPQALVTGYFGPLTQTAVIRFQEKYKNEILAPLGLTSGTGFVGPATRAKMNELW